MSETMTHIEKKKMVAPELRFKTSDSKLTIFKLDELVTFKSGGTPAKDNPLYWGGVIPWISAASMNGKYYSTSERTITEDGLKNGSKLAPQGCLLLLVRGSMLFNKIPIGITEVDVAFNQDLKALSPNKNTTTDFLYQWVSSKQNLLLDKVVGTGLGAGKLDTEDLKNLIVYLPTLPEQQKIAAFLSSVDEKIQQLTRKKQLLEQYKKGVMQQLFSGKLRFKDEDGKVFPEWEEKRVDHIFKVTRGNVLAVPRMSKIITDKTPYPVYSSQTKESGLTGFYDEFLFEDSITWTTDGANAGEVNFRKGKFYCTNVCGVLVNEKGFSNQCIAQILNSVSRKYVSYVGNPKLMNNVMAVIKIIIPVSVEEQQKIADYLSNIDNKIESVNKQITQTQAFKKGLLQQMFV